MSALISHQDSRESDLAVHEQRLRGSAATLTLPLDETLVLLHQLTEFPLGRFLLRNRGLNGYWTAWLILHGPQEARHPLEQWLVNHAPTVCATRERFGIFRQQLNATLRPGATLCSVPCGLMDDLLGLDDTAYPDIRRVGIDLDPDSLRLAERNAQSKGKEATFILQDAWSMDMDSQYDILTSNGLNIYQPDRDRVVELYGRFFRAIKPGGKLVTSTLMPPPWPLADAEHLKKQKAIFVDILQVGWQCFRTADETCQQLQEAGFTDCDILWDSRHMFPTVVAYKPAL